MSYTKQTWQTGDTITAAKLNHMEDGIDGAGGGGGALFPVTLTMSGETDGTCDKSASEIAEAYLSGYVPVISIVFGNTRSIMNISTISNENSADTVAVFQSTSVTNLNGTTTIVGIAIQVYDDKSATVQRTSTIISGGAGQY